MGLGSLPILSERWTSAVHNCLAHPIIVKGQTPSMQDFRVEELMTKNYNAWKEKS